MKKWLIEFLFSFFQGAGIFTMAMSISKWGKITIAKEGLLIFIGLVCIAISLFIWYKYKHYLGAINPDLPKSKLRNFYSRYPLLVRFMSMVIGIFIALIVYRLLIGE